MPRSTPRRYPAETSTRQSRNGPGVYGIRKDKGQLLAIQFDGKLHPSNSGGPMLDSSGKVIGMVTEMVPGGR